MTMLVQQIQLVTPLPTKLSKMFELPQKERDQIIEFLASLELKMVQGRNRENIVNYLAQLKDTSKDKQPPQAVEAPDNPDGQNS